MAAATSPTYNPSSSVIGTIFRKTLARGRVTLISFAVGMAVFEFVTALAYQAIGGNRVGELIGAFGPDLQKLLKLVPNLQAGFGPLNYLSLGYFHPVFLGLGSAFVVSRASDAVAGDIERGTILFVLSRPVARWQLLTAKALEMAVSLLIVIAAALLGTFAALPFANLGVSVDFWPFVAIGLNSYVLFLALGGVALIVSALSSSAAQVAGIATAFALTAFAADFLASVPVVNWLGFISPFRFYDPQTIVGNGGQVPFGSLVVLLATAVIGFAIALYLFQRRDING